MRQHLSIIILLFVFVPLVTNAETRRHIIVLQDNSGSYYSQRNESQIQDIQNKVIKLFQNEQVGDNSSLLNKERELDGVFYDEKRDVVSFYYFIADQPDNVSFFESNTASYREFEQGFFKFGGVKHPYDNNQSITLFLESAFRSRPPIRNCPNYYGLRTYSFSAYAYPLCMDMIIDDYAEEYVVIVISDFNAGSTFGNRNDEKILRQAFKDKANKVIKRVNELNAELFKIDYFDYYKSTTYEGLIGFIGYKIRPNIGSRIPENVDLRINSNIELVQKKFSEDVYTLKSAEVVFDHNEKVSINKVYIRVKFADCEEPCIVDVSNRMKYDSVGKTYKFNDIDIPLKSKNNPTQSFDGEFKFLFYLEYETGGDNSIKYAYNIGRDIDNTNIVFKTKLSNVQIAVMVLLIILVLAAAIAWVLHRLGKPQGIELQWNHFNDNYETIDFSSEGSGRVHTDYHAWNPVDNDRGICIKVNGSYKYMYHNRFFNWKEQTGFPVTITPSVLDAPQGFTMYLTADNKVTNSANISIVTDSFENNQFSFKVIIKKDDYSPLNDVVPFKIQVDVVGKNAGTFRKFYYSKKVSYDFHIGPDLGNVWVGVDPGTTGSCIATATEVADLTIEKDSDGHDLITPSTILIKNGELHDSNEDSIRNKIIFGKKAQVIKISDTDEKNSKFVSIKKYLGYNETFVLNGAGNSKISVRSSFLSTLMIEKLFEEHKSFLEDESRRKDCKQFLEDNKYAPKRAVFAIPNNFTASKIQHLKYCIQSSKLTSLKDIRFIYEAEAILVNYLHGTPPAPQSFSSGENIFIFDMGGATINATLANVRICNGNYKISILAKLGYNIGGDTIDYAILKWIFSKAKYYPGMAKKNPFSSDTMSNRAKKIEYILDILSLKLSIIDNYKNNKRNYILDRDKITKFTGETAAHGDEEDKCNDIFNNEILKDKNCFLYGKDFEDLIWSNIADIVHDIMEKCKEKNLSDLHTVIMSGRSSHFPRVADIVRNTIKPFFSDVSYKLLDVNESKSAVAKGACYYGVENARFTLSNRGVNGVFGVIQTLSPDASPIFHRLISDGAAFIDGVATGSCPINQEQEFVYNGKKVRFCQVMGINAEQVIANREKHKYTEIAAIKAQPFAIKQAQMSVTEKDKVICSVTDVNDDVQNPVEGMVSDADIIACNDAQYTFFIK